MTPRDFIRTINSDHPSPYIVESAEIARLSRAYRNMPDEELERTLERFDAPMGHKAIESEKMRRRAFHISIPRPRSPIEKIIEGCARDAKEMERV